MLKKIKRTDEQFIPTDTNFNEVMVNLERYFYAAHHCKDKIVLDAGCGTGLGTYIYSLVAKKVIAVDHRKEAIEYAKEFPFERGKVQFIVADINKDVLPEHDVTIALEVIEHLESPDFFLSQAKGKEMVFSIPLNSLEVSPEWHKFDFKTLADVKEVMERYYEVPEYFAQYGIWIYGKGNKKPKI